MLDPQPWVQHLPATPGAQISTNAAHMVQMVRGIKQVHSMRVLHLDVKPDNFLLHDEAGHTCVKIADFGSSLDEGTAPSAPPVHT